MKHENVLCIHRDHIPAPWLGQEIALPVSEQQFNQAFGDHALT